MINPTGYNEHYLVEEKVEKWLERSYGYCHKHPGAHRLTGGCVEFTAKYDDDEANDPALD